MNSAKLHDWLEIIGIAAVVASLLFVSLQLKQSQEIAIAGQYQARFETVAAFAVAQMQSGPAMSVIGKETQSGRSPARKAR